MLTPDTDNKEIIRKLNLLIEKINFRLSAFSEIEKNISNKSMVDLLQDLIIYDLMTIMDDNIFPFR